MSATRMIEEALAKVRATAGVKTVYGEPIKVDGKTIIPVAKVAFGAKAAPPDTHGTDRPAADATGEGGRVGAYAAPVGVVEISGEETKFVPVAQAKKLAITAAIGSVVGLVFGWLLGRRGRNDQG